MTKPGHKQDANSGLWKDSPALQDVSLELYLEGQTYKHEATDHAAISDALGVRTVW